MGRRQPVTCGKESIRFHAGEFQRLLEILTGDEDQWLAEGREKVDEMAAKLDGAG